jgi:hypothetical protein
MLMAALEMTLIAAQVACGSDVFVGHGRLQKRALRRSARIGSEEAIGNGADEPHRRVATRSSLSGALF